MKVLDGSSVTYTQGCQRCAGQLRTGLAFVTLGYPCECSVRQTCESPGLWATNFVPILAPIPVLPYRDSVQDRPEAGTLTRLPNTALAGVTQCYKCQASTQLPCAPLATLRVRDTRTVQNLHSTLSRHSGNTESPTAF